MLALKAVEFANSINPDEVAHNGLPHMDLHCWPPLNSEYNIALTLKAPITTAADDIHKYLFIVFQRK